MAKKFSTGHVNVGANAWKVAYANFVIDFFDGIQPASSDDSEGDANLLGLVTLNGGAFVAGEVTNGLNFSGPVDGVLSKPVDDIWKLTGLAAAGTEGKRPTWFRVYSNEYVTGASTTSCRYDGAIGTTSSYEIKMTNPIIVQGVETSLSLFNLRTPKSA